MGKEKIQAVIIKISKELEKNNIIFGVGGSCLLKKYNLVENPKDIDIVINGEDIEKIRLLMDKLGIIEKVEFKSKFKTKDFFAYIIDNVKVEFMADFGIELYNKFIYRLNLNKENIKYVNLEGQETNYCLIEDWYVAYLVMEDPKDRCKLIEGYFKEKGIERKDILEKYLNQDLTLEIKERIRKVLSF